MESSSTFVYEHAAENDSHAKVFIGEKVLDDDGTTIIHLMEWNENVFNQHHIK